MIYRQICTGTFYGEAELAEAGIESSTSRIKLETYRPHLQACLKLSLNLSVLSVCPTMLEETRPEPVLEVGEEPLGLVSLDLPMLDRITTLAEVRRFLEAKIPTC